MKILYVSPEVVPFAKTGGLADVAGALPKALSQIGHEVRIILPRYKMIDLAKWNAKLVFTTALFSLYETKLPDAETIVYFVDHPDYFGSRDGLYQVKGQDYPDNLERFTFFAQTVITVLKQLNWAPHIIHCNDWQSALVCEYLKVTYKSDPFFSRTAAVYSIHNMAYMGLFPKEKFAQLDLPPEEYSLDKLEFWGQIALAKAGLVCADVINTVSETYSQEIQTAEYGYGLEGLLSKRKADLYGIVNGVDYSLWNPASDPYINKHYNANTISIKQDNKLKLQRDSKLPENKDVLLLGMVSRLAAQKGVDILSQAFLEIMRLGVQMVILGDGDPEYCNFFAEAQKKYPKQLAINLGFNAALAQEIYAGADIFLMPSHYEPCGLGQLISFKYGTIPLVRKTGGLADTVHEFDPVTGEGDGFVFDNVSATEFLAALKRAVSAYKNREAWVKLQKKVMAYDYSWDASGKKYVWLYKKALEKIGL